MAGNASTRASSVVLPLAVLLLVAGGATLHSPQQMSISASCELRAASCELRAATASRGEVSVTPISICCSSLTTTSP
jgi:hypothetical protein